MKLNPTQIKYARERINVAANKRIQLAKKSLGPAPELSKFSFADKYALIAKGVAKLKPISKISHYTDLTDAYDYIGRDKIVVEHNKTVAAHELKISKAVAKVEEEKSKLLDRLMLGIEGEDVLKAIEKFAAGK